MESTASLTTVGGSRPEVEATLYIIGMYVTTVTFLPSYPILKPQDGWSCRPPVGYSRCSSAAVPTSGRADLCAICCTLPSENAQPRFSMPMRFRFLRLQCISIIGRPRDGSWGSYAAGGRRSNTSAEVVGFLHLSDHRGQTSSAHLTVGRPSMVATGSADEPR